MNRTRGSECSNVKGLEGFSFEGEEEYFIAGVMGNQLSCCRIGVI